MSVKNDATIAEMIAEFEQIISWFDSDDFSLEKAAAQYEKAQVLASDIEKKLSSLKNDITILKQKFDA